MTAPRYRISDLFVCLHIHAPGLDQSIDFLPAFSAKYMFRPHLFPQLPRLVGLDLHGLPANPQ